MAITYVSTASAAATSVTLPTHQAGDLIVMFAYDHTNTTTTITLPAGWTSIQHHATNGGRSGRIAIKTATSSADTSGTWTGATMLICSVYRSNADHYLTAGNYNTQTGLSVTSLSYRSVSPILRSSASWVIGACGTSADTTADTAPTLMTNRGSLVSTGEVAMHDTNAAVTGWSDTAVACSSTGYRSYTVEIFETDGLILSGAGGGVPLIGPGGLVY